MSKLIEAVAALKPCPFCGGKAERLIGDGRWCQIGCAGQCGAKGTEYPNDWIAAERDWNRRAHEAEQATGWRDTQVSEEVVERVAVSICVWRNGKKHPGNARHFWASLPEREKAAYRDQAKAAVATMQAGKESEG